MPAYSPAAVPASAERKQITVLFADVAGSMDLQERLDAEVWAQIMGRFVSILAEGIRKFGGTVDKFTGDGIMALFGAPVAQEDHARRACHAAWHLTKVIREYSEELAREQGVQLQVRLGLNSGEVVVGRVGDDVTLDPTALGHTVGLAQRMEAMAEPGQAFLTEYTARLAEGFFGLEDLGPKPVRGARRALNVYVLGGPVSAPGRRPAGTAPMVGRDREFAVLDDALAAAMEGHAQVVGVVGEAGVGKSRLCEEFVASAAVRGITVRRATGVSHGRDVPLLPILGLLRDYFGVTEGDDAELIREKITGQVLDLDPDLDAALPLLFDFLEVPDPARPAAQLAAEVRMRRIFEALRRLTQRRSEREVLVLLVEDLHWFDPQSEAFLERLIESFPGSRTLLVANFRPEFSAGWMRHSYYRQMPLAPLEDTAVGELLSGLLGVELSLAPLLGFVQERTGGNPFFVEEVVRALVEDGTLAGQPGMYRLTRPLRQVTVPPSVHAVLAARIDRLPPDYKAVLQTAAVIGRTFDRTVLTEVSDSTGDALEDALSALCAAEMLQKTPDHPAAEFRFWHPLTQEVAYNSLLSEHRGRVHGAVAEAVTALESDRLDELSAVVAWHWERAGRPLEAARWNMRAADWALRADLGDAKRRWRTAIDLLATTEETREGQALGVRARMRLMQFGSRVGIDPSEADQLFLEARALGEGLGDIPLLAMVLVGRGAVKLNAGELTEARRLLVEGADLGRTVPDEELRAVLSMAAAVPFVFCGPLPEGLTWANRALAACSEDPDRGVSIVGYSPLVRALNFRSESLMRMGRLPEARHDAGRALAIARPRAEPEVLSWTLAVLPDLAWYTGANDDLRAEAKEAVRIAEDTGNTMALVVALNALSLAELIAGRPLESLAAAGRGLAEARSGRSGLFLEGELLTRLAVGHLATGDAHRATDVAGEAVETARRQQTRVSECLALLTRAQTARTTGRTAAAETDLQNAAVLMTDIGALTYEPFIHEELGRLHNDDSELRVALRLYRQIGATGHARRLEAELSARAAR